jgi:hypothetical protein
MQDVALAQSPDRLARRHHVDETGSPASMRRSASALAVSIFCTRALNRLSTLRSSPE